MRVVWSWLRELVEFEASPGELAEALTMAGIAVEQVDEVSTDALSGMVVAQAVAVDPHPDASGLRLVRMHTGREELSVVTGATNIHPGDRVSLALPGARLGDGQRVAPVEIRGLASQGMLLSARELGIPECKDFPDVGLLTLPPDTPVGQPLATALAWREAVLILELTPNYAHCLGLWGLAHEVAAVTRGRLRPAGNPLPSLPADRRVEPWTQELCSRYAGLLVEQVRPGPSPWWMRRRLDLAGLRPVNNLVDVTNYVLLERNQPLHAFDAARLTGDTIGVRGAREGERLTTLDGEERVLGAGVPVVVDAQGPVALAGVMGGAATEVTSATRAVFLESACFEPTAVRRAARRLGVRSEASVRFERGTDPEGAVAALARAAELLPLAGAAGVLRALVDRYPHPLPPLSIPLRPARINRWLGTGFEAAEMEEALAAAGFTLRGDMVEVPSYRRDVAEEVDLAEEAARILGYHRVPERLPGGGVSLGRRLKDPAGLRARRVLAALGLQEVLTSPLTGAQTLELFADAVEAAVPLDHPLVEEQGLLRVRLLPSLLEVLRFNVAQRNLDVAVYEVGKVFRRTAEGVSERRQVALAWTGRGREDSWAEAGPTADFFRLKGLVERLLDSFGLTLECVPWGGTFLHPGRGARVLGGGVDLGFLGQLHPETARRMELSEAVLVAELELAELARCEQAVSYHPLPRFPAVLRDLAAVLPREVSAGRVAEVIRAAGAPLLEAVRLFDVYEGPQVPPGRRSLAYSLGYRSGAATLTDREVDAVHERVRRALQRELGAVLRS